MPVLVEYSVFGNEALIAVCRICHRKYPGIKTVHNAHHFLHRSIYIDNLISWLGNVFYQAVLFLRHGAQKKFKQLVTEQHTFQFTRGIHNGKNVSGGVNDICASAFGSIFRVEYHKILF